MLIFVLVIKPIKSRVEIGIKGKTSERERDKSYGFRTTNCARILV